MRRLTTSKSRRDSRVRVDYGSGVYRRRFASVAMVVVGRLKEGRVVGERLKNG